MEIRSRENTNAVNFTQPIFWLTPSTFWSFLKVISLFMQVVQESSLMQMNLLKQYIRSIHLFRFRFVNIFPKLTIGELLLRSDLILKLGTTQQRINLVNQRW